MRVLVRAVATATRRLVNRPVVAARAMAAAAAAPATAAATTAAAAPGRPFSVGREVYPATEPHETGWLDVGDGHSLYFEVSGRRDGKPAVFLHGGPGSGTSPAQRQFFDPTAYRIVLFDQRGAGKSTPAAATTLAGLEKIVRGRRASARGVRGAANR